jgi:hypothetical protein
MGYMPFIQFPFIEVPKDLLPIVGEPTPGTRAYRREGTFKECGEWFETLAARLAPASQQGWQRRGNIRSNKVRNAVSNTVK